MFGLRERHQYSDQRSSRIRALCVASTAAGTEEKKDQIAWLSALKRAVGGKKRRRWKIIDKNRKVPGQEQILAKHLDGLERSDFCDFEKPHKRVYQKGKIEFNEQSKEGDLLKLVWGKRRDARQSEKLSSSR